MSVAFTKRISFRSFQTFNFEKFFDEHKTPFRELYVLNDETLAGGSSVKMKVQEDSSIILLPVVGAVDYKDSSGNETMVNAGEIQNKPICPKEVI